MATSASPKFTGGSELKLAVLIGMATVLFLMGAWAFNRIMGQPSEPERPKPTWLGVSPVRAQTSDGRMLSVKVNFMLKSKDDLDELTPYEPAFKSIVAEAGANLSSDDAIGRDNILHFGETVKASVNDYLNEQRIKPRVKRVAFEEFRLLP
ncbi:MAG TPA: flagellar basal body-associated FliL family protein [Aquabacterium sp.]|nr:flagellar basal body-associated FliL family protein [Aquabacterium sp.]